MPDITATPVLIDVSAQEGKQLAFQNPYFSGPIKVGSNLYCVLFAQGVAFPLPITVFKSTDGGLTWIQQDAANSPTRNGTTCKMQVVLNPDGVTITIGYNSSSAKFPATVSFVTFSTVTDTFTSGVIPSFSATDASGGAGLLSYDFLVRVNGDILLAFPLIIAPNVTEFDMGFVVLSGGIWGAYQSVAVASDGGNLGYDVPTLLLDQATGLTHFFCRHQLAGVQTTSYLQISPTNVSTVLALIEPPVANIRRSYGRPVLWNNSIVLAEYFTDQGPPITYTMRAFIGTPSATPVFLFTDLGTNNTWQNDVERGQVAVDSDGTLWAIWVNFPALGGAVIEILRATNTGLGWNAPQVFYDLNTNPPNVVPATSQLITAVNLAPTGSLGAVVIMRTANLDTASFFLLGAGAPPIVTTATLTLVKSVTPGGAATAVDFILSANGPVDLSGAGGFGPTTVPLGTYSLGETPVSGYQQAGWSLVGGGTLIGDQLTLAAGDVAVVTLVNNPTAKPTAGGAKFFPRYLNLTLLMNQFQIHQAPLSAFFAFPNDFDICLSREWRIFHQIDPQAMSCGRKPSCFLEGFQGKEWVDPPHGAIQFNPDKAIPLPAAASGDVVVFSFRVPIGYDGIVLGQYHGYAGPGTFIEGGGDLAWRVKVCGNRYLRDMGNMLVSLGSPQQLSPCPGGLWLYSGDLVEYIVTAPNTSGLLPLPGQGNILAGLNGFFFTRR